MNGMHVRVQRKRVDESRLVYNVTYSMIMEVTYFV
jgi:hypothetical protein